MKTTTDIESQRRGNQKTAWWSILHLRCPRCRRGLVYRSLLGMNNLCPVCGLKFERESGYFIGSMYISYGFAAILVTLFSFILSRLYPEMEFHWIVLLAGVALLPFVPMIIRYSRVLWMHFDRAFDPDR